ncbi:MAG TPA: hypothetical protein VHK91_03220, partial [Flavisolibacter sp.]|nr:hypothetical protein [Flavisolibacter sp.]
MKRILVLILLLAGIPVFSWSQDLTGIWKGYFITESGEQYRLEFQVQQKKKQLVSGVSYSYLDTRFYGKSTMTGNFSNLNKSFSIQELRTVEVRNMAGNGTCLMNYRFTYTKSGREEFLEGTYLGKSEDRRNPKNNGKWGDCGSGTVFLRRVTQSDFYVEPFLRNSPSLRTPDTSSGKPVSKPPVKNTSRPPVKTVPGIAVKKPPVAKPPVTKPPVMVSKPKEDTLLNTRRTTSINTEKPVEKPRITIPVTTRARKNELTQSLTVSSDEIMIRLYDNGEIDNDTISVYLDGQLILSQKRLSASPITYTLKMDESNPEHVLVMVAENMGRIPPNTSLMIVQ